MKTSFLKAVAVAACLNSYAWAQTTAPSLKEITVTANPLGSSEVIAPVVSYSGSELLLRSKTTLGATLDDVPGVSSTYFGPNASRPIIRGMDGDRIRILNNGTAALDASSLSFDHAVTADPLSMERVEVLRGPGALLYGGSAVGGVVNVIDGRIARQALFDPKGGLTGRLDLDAASGNRQTGTGVSLETGTDRFGLHVDGFNRRTSDVSVPISLSCTQNGVTTQARRLCNSASDTSGGAVGGSVFFDRGYLGASISNYQSNYGTVAEDEAKIGMKSSRYALEGEVRDLGGFMQSLRAQYSRTDYSHGEFDAGVLGTSFQNKGYEARLQARHAPLGPWQGVFGLQSEVSSFSAVGDEAFAPYSRTQQRAVFVYEERPSSWGKFSLGARLENVQVQSFGNPEQTRFIAAKRDFAPSSWAAGALWKLTPAWEVTGNFSATQRAPKDYELFADGPHLATVAYEIGNANLGKERSNSLDLGVAWKGDIHQFDAHIYTSRFQNYLGLIQTPGVTHTVNGEDLPEFKYLGVRASFVGAELSGVIGLLQGPRQLNLALRADIVRASNLTANEPLPRIAPLRLGATAKYSQGPWGSELGFDHNAAQNRVVSGQTATAAYTLWHASASYQMKLGGNRWLWYANLDNITNKLAYSATSVLTTTAFPKAPLPGRSLKLGARLDF